MTQNTQQILTQISQIANQSEQTAVQKIDQIQALIQQFQQNGQLHQNSIGAESGQITGAQSSSNQDL
jgi:hypothetical protein